MIRYRREYLEVRVQILTQSHNAGNIAASVAVIRCRPDGHDVLRGEVVFVAFVHELMCAGYELEVVYMVELDMSR